MFDTSVSVTSPVSGSRVRTVNVGASSVDLRSGWASKMVSSLEFKRPL